MMATFVFRGDGLNGERYNHKNNEWCGGSVVMLLLMMIIIIMEGLWKQNSQLVCLNVLY